MEFIPGELYHIYNRGNNQQPIFFQRENYLYFLKKVRKELLPFCHILSYCLMPNHYHFLVKVKENYIVDKKDILSRKIGTLQSSYTQAINKKFTKKGSLFQQRAKNKLLNRKLQAFICFHYIHQNPLKARLCSRMDEWQFSSFIDYVGKRNGTLPSYEVTYKELEIDRDPVLFYNQSMAVIREEVIADLFC